VFSSDRGIGTANLWEIDIGTGVIRQIYSDPSRIWFFSISSDDRIALSTVWHDTFLFSVDVESGEGRQLTSHTRDNFGARFSPQGNVVAYHSTRTGDSEVWIHDVTSGVETRLTHNAGWELYPDWSPDGEHLVFTRDLNYGDISPSDVCF
jgi:Tol biopolymer transport system component